MKKRLISWALATAMMLTMVPTMAFAEDAEIIPSDTEVVEEVRNISEGIDEIFVEMPQDEEIATSETETTEQVRNITENSEEIRVISADPEETYTATVTDTVENYNVGDTFTMNIVATATDNSATVAHFQFKPVYDSAVLTLDGVTTTFEDGTLEEGSNGIYVFTTTGDSSKTVGADGVVIATMTFTIASNEGKEEQAKIANGATTTVDLSNVAISGKDSPVTTTTSVSDSITIYDIQVTFTNATDADGNDIYATVASPNGGSLTAFAKYGVEALYTDRTYEQSYVFPTVSLTAGYQLDTNIWVNSASAEYATDAALIAAIDSLDASITVSPKVSSLTTITYVVEGQGTIAEAGPVYANVNDEITLPTVTTDPNYDFAGWTYTISTNEPVDIEPTSAGGSTYEYTVTADDVTITAKFTPKTFTVTANATNVTVEHNSSTTLANATYGEDYKVTVTAISGAITSVSYSIENGATGVLLTGASGVYTIPGEQITGAVTITAVATEYVTITFKEGTGTTLTDGSGNNVSTSVNAYAVKNVAGLYASVNDIPDGVATFIVPTVAATTNYRIDESALWGDGETTYTTGSLYVTSTFDNDTTLTSKAIEQITITFAAGDNGEISYATVIVDTGTAVSDIPEPDVTPNTGYVFDKWTASPTTDPVTEATTFTATYAVATYDATLSGATATEGVTNGKVTHGTGVTFTTDETDNDAIESIWYRVGTGTATEITVNATGSGNSYTIDGSNITGPISIWVVTKDTFTVNFVVLDDEYTDLSEVTSTSIVDNKLTIETVTVINEHTVATGVVTGENGAQATAEGYAEDGYEFLYWSVSNDNMATGTNVYMTSTQIEAMKITVATTFTAVYRIGEFDVTVVGDNVTGIPEIAVGLEDFVFTPEVAGATVTDVTAEDEDGSEITVTKNSDGSYTIDDEDITGPITITVVAISGTLTFIYDSQYKALTGDTKIAVLSGAKSPGTDIYTIDGIQMYYCDDASYTSTYGGGDGVYLLIIDESKTADEVLDAMSVATSGTLTTITYNNDVNSDSVVNVTDAGRINAFLHDLAITGATDGNAYSVFAPDNSDGTTMVSSSQQLERLKADVNTTSVVSVLDIDTVVDAVKEATIQGET